MIMALWLQTKLTGGTSWVEGGCTPLYFKLHCACLQSVPGCAMAVLYHRTFPGHMLLTRTLCF